MPKISIEEKRLQSLYKQLYGKQTESKESSQLRQSRESSIESGLKDDTYKASTFDQLRSFNLPKTTLVDSQFLRKDLIKILFLSAAVLGVQFIIYFSSLRGLINLNLKF